MWYQHAIVCAKHFANIVLYHLQEGKNLYMKEEIELNKTWISLLSEVIIQILSMLSPGVVKMLHSVIRRQMESNLWSSKCSSALSPGVLNIPYWVISGADWVKIYRQKLRRKIVIYVSQLALGYRQ